MSIIDDDSIGVGNINTILNNRRWKQYIIVIVHKAHDYLLQFLRFHLPMSDSDTAIGYVLLDKVCYLWKITNTVINEINLSITAHFKVNSICYYFMRERSYLGLNRITVGWWCTHNTHVACAHQWELERTWDRRCRHRKGVNIRFQLSEFLLCRDTELLFFINDKESEVVPLHRFTYQLMRADKNINLSLCQILQHLFCLFGTTSTWEVVNTYRHILQSLLKGLVMLKG